MFFPMALFPSFVSLGIDYLLKQLDLRGVVPVYLLLSVVQTSLIFWIYKFALDLQGQLLQRRELFVMDAITKPIE